MEIERGRSVRAAGRTKHARDAVLLCAIDEHPRSERGEKDFGCDFVNYFFSIGLYKINKHKDLLRKYQNNI